jgi:hypothetical protein
MAAVQCLGWSAASCGAEAVAHDVQRAIPKALVPATVFRGQAHAGQKSEHFGDENVVSHRVRSLGARIRCKRPTTIASNSASEVGGGRRARGRPPTSEALFETPNRCLASPLVTLCTRSATHVCWICVNRCAVSEL